MNEWKILYKVCKQAETKFDNVICYAYKDGLFWNICIDDYDKYLSKEYKEFTSKWHKILKAAKINAVFCYCHPSEERLFELAQKDNLILIT